MDNGYNNQKTNGPKKQRFPLSMTHQVEMKKEPNRL